MTWFSKANPIPAFPAYTGPYKVGSVDVEIPVAELKPSSPAPSFAPPTVAFRVFYPCEPSSSSKRPVRWVPSPQRDYLSSYAAFTGAGSVLSNAFSYLSHFMTYVTIPVLRNARLLPPPTSNKRWPVMIFSHGLAGSRNAYSQICGSLSSHGIVVIATDHRDGSAPLSHIRSTPTSSEQTVKYRPISHHQTPEVFEQRHEQLSTRLWELDLVHDAIQRLDMGSALTNLDLNSNHHRKKDRNDVLAMFKDQLHVHEPGVIAWAGHSFGAASVVQFIKSTYWRVSTEQPGYNPLFTPAEDSNIVNQVTPSSPVILLDLWCLPLTMPQLDWLKQKPLPCYSESGPGGRFLLAILSEAFYKWKTHLEETRRTLAENPTSPDRYTKAPPQLFYRASSAHLSQSDFGLLYPWLTEKVLKAEEPEQTIRLNTRAVLQVLRNAGLQVAKSNQTDINHEANGNGAHVISEQELEDKEILQTDGSIRGWVALTTDLNSSADPAQKSSEKIDKSPAQAVVENEVLSKTRSR